MDLSSFAGGFGTGVLVGGFAVIAAIRYFEKRYSEVKSSPSDYVPFVRRPATKKKPVIMDEAKEVRKEQERLREGS